MPIDIIYLAALSVIVVFGSWITLWLISLIMKDSSIGDPMYPFIMALVAVIIFAYWEGNPARQRLILVMTLLWAARLGWHIGSRNWGHEDPRYARLRTHAQSLGKSYAWYSLTHVFLSLGALCGAAIAFPLFLGQRTSTPDPGLLSAVGILLFIFGLIFETVADMQLRKFLKNPDNKNKVLQTGLWGYSRHPNYFGEFIVWCGFFLIALETPWGWLAIVSPLTLLYILLGPLGIGLVERRMRKKRPEAFAEYERKTNAFIPWFK